MSQYANAVPNILADMEKDREEGQEAQQQPDQRDDVPELVIHRYRVEGGGVILSSIPLDEDQQPPIVDSKPSVTAPARKAPPFFVIALLIFSLFLLLDSADTTLTALFSPTATVTLVPKSETITLKSSLPLGKLLSPITVSQSVTVPTTGVKHQKATEATGTLVFYNGSSSPQYIQSGSVFTGSDGVKVTIDQNVTVPAANLPAIGSIPIFAHAVLVGSQGNIAAFDINSSLSPDLKVRNEAAFSNGLDERYFQVVTKADITNAAQALKVKVTSSMSAALHGQLTSTEQMQQEPCNPQITANHQAGDETSQVTVTVAEKCTALVYDSQELTTRAMQLLSNQARATLGTGYALKDIPTVTVTKATTTNTKTVVLHFTCSASWIYQINEPAIKALLTGKTKVEALRLLHMIPGIKRASINGIGNTDLIPTDAMHIKFLLIYAPF
ncbi:MAG: hypothetical protein ACRDIV_13925 [Ktedonobacteraceae bacterium]